jgi:hypothetical protein
VGCRTTEDIWRVTSEGARARRGLSHYRRTARTRRRGGGRRRIGGEKEDDEEEE